MNAAIDQQCEKYIIENNLKEEVNKRIEAKCDIESLPRYVGQMENLFIQETSTN